MQRDFVPLPPLDRRPLVLVTGAAGNIGGRFAEFAAERYRLRLLALPGDANIDRIRAFGEVVECDLSDLDRLKQAMAGVDACVHLAGDPNPGAVWDDLLRNNVVASYNVYAAAKAAGCPRVIYASSIHAVSGYPAGLQVRAGDAVNPGDLYGVSKCFAEALGRYMAEQEGVGGVAIRIGTYQPDEKVTGDFGLRVTDSWVSPRDLNQLIIRAVESKHVRFAVVHGVSNNAFNRLEIQSARELLGYEPQDDITAAHPKLAPLELPEHTMQHSLQDQPDPPANSGLREHVSLKQ